jgi:hypothetical protein
MGIMKNGETGQGLDPGKRETHGAGNNYIIVRFMIYTLQYILLYNESKIYERGSDGSRECIQDFVRKASLEYRN